MYATDPKQGKRIAYRIIEGNPTEKHVDGFCEEIASLLAKRGMTVSGVTTDGSPLYPSPIGKHFPDARHQICVFHVLKELNKLVLRALARFRQELKARLGPKRSRGRPKKSDTKQIANQNKQTRYIHSLFEARTLWVKRHLTAKDCRTLKKLCRGQPLLRALRELVDTVYALFDKRCRSQTARRKLKKLRRRRFFQRFPELEAVRKKLGHPNLDKALEFLDDKLLEKTSNAVERSNRRHRKMQNTVYRVRTAATIEGRIKLDMMRDRFLLFRGDVVTTLHQERLTKRQPSVHERAAWESVKRRKKAS